MGNYIKEIKINKTRHLEDLIIPISQDGSLKHIIITGKNGSGRDIIKSCGWGKKKSKSFCKIIGNKAKQKGDALWKSLQQTEMIRKC